MLLATALALLTQDVSSDVYCSKQTGSSSTKGNHHPSLFVSGIGQKKTVDAAKIVAAENVVKTETQQTFVNGLLGFTISGIYTPPEARVYCSSHNNCMSCPSIWATLSALLINILQSLPLFFTGSFLSEGEIIPFSVPASRGVTYPRRSVAASRTD